MPTPKPKPRKPAVRATANRKLAKKIARFLFTNGNGDRSTRLVMANETRLDLGGWSELAVAYQVERLLAAARKGGA